MLARLKTLWLYFHIIYVPVYMYIVLFIYRCFSFLRIIKQTKRSTWWRTWDNLEKLIFDMTHWILYCCVLRERWYIAHCLCRVLGLVTLLCVKRVKVFIVVCLMMIIAIWLLFYGRWWWCIDMIIRYAK